MVGEWGRRSEGARGRKDRKWRQIVYRCTLIEEFVVRMFEVSLKLLHADERLITTLRLYDT